MACRKGELRCEGKPRNTAAAASSVAVGDALLFTTMCIIGMPVDVHVIDGSIYYGIFHTASVDKDYAIVLKKARMIKKGNLDANVVNGTSIETLIVRSEDLVQVVAKGFLLPSNGITGYVGGDSVEAAGRYDECLDRDAEVLMHNGSKVNKKHKTQSRFAARKGNSSPYNCTAQIENVLVSSSEVHIQKKIQKMEDADTISVDRRQVGDSLQEIQNDCHNNPEFQVKKNISEVRGSSPSITSHGAQSISAPNIMEDTVQTELKRVSSGCFNSLEDQGQQQPPSDDTACRVASVAVVDGKPDSCLTASSNPFVLIPPKTSSVKSATKESKLNPAAKMFSPTMPNHRTVTTSSVQNGTSAAYAVGTYAVAPMAAAPEVDANSFAPHVPVKFVPCSNVAFGHGGNDASFVQPVIGQMLNRTQPVRYQYQSFQTGPAYVHPNPQNVMLGRVGPLVCVHPISGDVVQTAAGLSTATTRPLFTQHQMHLPKHQGNASAQVLQLCMTPPIIASGQQPYVMPNSIPISQPLFPVLRPMVPGSNSFLNTKFA